MAQYRICVVGAGIYGASIAIELAKAGHSITMFDPIGVLSCASSINQFRIHKGYHYPRSKETIQEVVESRAGFLRAYKDAVVDQVENYYAIPHEGSKTSPDTYEGIMNQMNLPYQIARPSWINYDVIDRCYLVDEEIYDPDLLRNLLEQRLEKASIIFEKRLYTESDGARFDFVIHATYGASGSHMHLFNDFRIQIVEKIKIELPVVLHKKSLVVVDGPFTAFDPYGNQSFSQFGSALHTNHWVTADPNEPLPSRYNNVMNLPDFQKVTFSNFDKMVDEASSVVPLCADARYIGSRFTKRLVEYAPESDRRVMRIGRPDNKNIHVFSGKVVSAIKSADRIRDMIANA